MFWEVPSLTKLKEFNISKDRILKIIVTKDQKRLAIALEDKRIIIME